VTRVEPLTDPFRALLLSVGMGKGSSQYVPHCKLIGIFSSAFWREKDRPA
jgi:monoamine oxidase